MSQTEKKDKEARAKSEPAKNQAAPAADPPDPTRDPGQEAGEEPEKTEDQSAAPPGPAWEKDLDEYPLREASEDPKWAVRTVRIWVGFGLISLTFIMTMLILGIFHD